MGSSLSPPPEQADVAVFRRRLMHWYRQFARELPWRGVRDPYATWVSEVMLQQTRVAAVLEHYDRFLRRFPTPFALALAAEADVLAAWSGLGYYRRARMLHRAAQFLVAEHGGRLPETAAELRTLPGIGEYTCAAIASIAFGESVAVIDGNVERVLLRVAGRADDGSAATRSFLRARADALVPQRRLCAQANTQTNTQASSQTGSQTNAAGDHNQAMMELGATICLPRAPLCLQCPVFELCATRGEHTTRPRDAMQSRTVACLLMTRKRGTATELLLEKRDTAASLMPGMLELPPLPLDAVRPPQPAREPILRLRHAITSTNYYVEVYAQSSGRASQPGRSLRAAVPAARETLCWHPVVRLGELPLTGLARKIVQRARLGSIAGPETPEHDAARQPRGEKRPATKTAVTHPTVSARSSD